MAEIDFFENPAVPEEDKVNLAFQVVSGMRDVINIASKNKYVPTYQKALAYIEDISPKFYNAIASHLPEKIESEMVRRFKEEADGVLPDNKKDQLNERAVEFIMIEIDKCERTIGSTKKNSASKGYKKQLNNALKSFETKMLIENQLLNHDHFAANRKGFKLIDDDTDRKDYRMANGKTLRVYLTHLTNVETALGVDMIYECYDLRLNLVRFVHLQYKVWKGTKLTFDEREEKQLGKLKTNVCSARHCKLRKEYSSTSDYRFPYCAAFVRPTNKMMPKGSQMKSMGDHIPVCQVNKLRSAQIDITKASINEISITQNVFEEGFSKSHIGSGWMPIGDLEEYYKKRKLNELAGNVRIIAQEIEFVEE